ncbi:MAG TPA: sulfite exporter TauE/SafE family protein [Terriglobales bacterium]|nr:sulfite exporter TauE/SafE family protein [Terriglobales bacterium]
MSGLDGLDALGWVLLVAGALAGSVVGGVAGFGAGITLLPILVFILGARAAIPVLTVTMAIGNLSRVWWSRGDVNPRVTGAFLAGAIPATAFGALLYAGTSGEWLSRAIGVFMLAALPLRRLLQRGGIVLRLRHFPLVGVAIGALSSVVVTTGPVATPFFLAYGLRKAGYIGTEAVCAMAMHLTRGTVFARYALLTWDAVALGCVLGGTMFLGSWIARRLVDRLSERLFLWFVEGLLVVVGLQFLLFPR